MLKSLHLEEFLIFCPVKDDNGVDAQLCSQLILHQEEIENKEKLSLEPEVSDVSFGVITELFTAAVFK